MIFVSQFSVLARGADYGILPDPIRAIMRSGLIQQDRECRKARRASRGFTEAYVCCVVGSPAIPAPS